MTRPEALIEAWDVAQTAFRAMLECGKYADPDDPCTRAYVAAERRVDSVLIDLQGQRAQAALDTLIDGDHFAYPAGFATISPRDGARLER